MGTNNNKKTNMPNMTKLKKELKNYYVKELRKNCKILVSLSVEERDENGKYLDYKEKAERNGFSMAYRKAKLHFNHLVDLGEERTATVVFGKNAFESAEFRCAEKEYIKIHPEAGGFFDRLKYYDYTNKEKYSERNIEEAKREKKKPNFDMAPEARNSRHSNKKKIVITIIVALITAIIAFAVAACKKGFKPVVKACLCGFAMFSTILVFDKAKKDMLKRIKNKFYGSNE